MPHGSPGSGPGAGPCRDPGGERTQQVVAADEVVLQGQDAEEQVAPGVTLRSRRQLLTRPGRGPEGGETAPSYSGNRSRYSWASGRSPRLRRSSRSSATSSPSSAARSASSASAR